MFASPSATVSVLNHVDPRSRLVAALGLAVVTVALEDLHVLLAALAGAVVAVLLARLPAARVARHLAAVDGFVLLAVAMLPFTTPGQPVFSIFGLTASGKGLADAAAIALKANTVLLLAVALVGALDARGLGYALSGLGVPRALVHILLFMSRYVAVLEQEYRRARVAMRARAFQPRSNLHTWRSLGYLVGMLLVRALERAERILQAMKCRGFDGDIPLDGDSRFGAPDAAFGAVAAGAAIGLLALEMLA